MKRNVIHISPLFYRVDNGTVKRGFVVNRWLCILFAMGAIVVVSTGVSLTIARRHAQNNKELRVSEESLDQIVFDLNAMLSHVIEPRLRDSRPLTFRDRQLLRKAQVIFERFGDGNTTQRMTSKQIVAYQNIAQINCIVGKYEDARQAFVNLKRIFEKLIAEPPSRELQLPWPDAEYAAPVQKLQSALADTNNRLTNVLVCLGRMNEARKVALDTVNELDATQSDTFFHPNNVDLAIAYHNPGLLATLDGRSDEGIKFLQRSVAILIDSAGQSPEDTCLVELLVDFEQVLGELLHRTGRLNEAHSACQAGINRITQLIKQAEGDTGKSSQSIVYRKALVLAQLNRDSIGINRMPTLVSTNPQPVPRSPFTTTPFVPSTAWNWISIFEDNGKILNRGLLVKGRLPGEFEHQDALVLAWCDEPWSHKVILEMIAASWKHIEIILLVHDELAKNEVRQLLSRANVPDDMVRFYQMEFQTPWTRDYAPTVIQLLDGTSRWVDTQYMFESFEVRSHDDNVPFVLARLFDMQPVVRVPMYLVGGNALTNGAGLYLTTTKVLNNNAAAGHDRRNVTNTIKRLFGAHEVLFLESLDGDLAGHVDWFATFTSPNVVVVGDYSGIDQANAEILDRNAERLAGLKTPQGDLKVVRIPMPPRGKRYFGGSYTNVVFANGVLLVPSWPEASAEVEQRVLETYRRLLPGWKVVSIDCREIGIRGGGLHCISRNLYRTTQGEDAVGRHPNDARARFPAR